MPIIVIFHYEEKEIIYDRQSGFRPLRSIFSLIYNTVGCLIKKRFGLPYHHAFKPR